MDRDTRTLAAAGEPTSRAFKALRALALEQAEFARELARFALGKARMSGSARPGDT
jgi:hypothetical protein